MSVSLASPLLCVLHVSLVIFSIQVGCASGHVLVDISKINPPSLVKDVQFSATGAIAMDPALSALRLPSEAWTAIFLGAFAYKDTLTHSLSSVSNVRRGAKHVSRQQSAAPVSNTTISDPTTSATSPAPRDIMPAYKPELAYSAPTTAITAIKMGTVKVAVV